MKALMRYPAILFLLYTPALCLNKKVEVKNGVFIANRLGVDLSTIPVDTIPLCTLVTRSHLYALQVKSANLVNIFVAFQLGARVMLIHGQMADFIDSSSIDISKGGHGPDTIVYLSGTHVKIKAPHDDDIFKHQGISQVFLLSDQNIQPDKFLNRIQDEMDRRRFPLTVASPELSSPTKLRSFAIIRVSRNQGEPQEARIFIASIPPLMNIYLDDKLVGKTNVVELKLPVGRNIYKFEINGKSFFKELDLQPGDNRSIMVKQE